LAQPTGLIDLREADPTLMIEAVYATARNFVGIPLYRSDRLYLLPHVAAKVVRINQRLQREGFRVKVWDAYRPHSVQVQMWKVMPVPGYVADPAKGSNHNRGCAVDVTLVDTAGHELPMGTGFDEFSERAHRRFGDLPAHVLENRKRLERAFVAEGFVPLPTEWWHYDDADAASYPVLNIEP
jgi:D-alanyl-D-alanine dipeptidase